VTQVAQTFRAAIAFAGAAALSVVAVSVAVAVGGGAQNGLDTFINGWIGLDDPGVQQDWSYNQVEHDFILSEWVEPSHDWVRTREMVWSFAAATKLNNISATRNLEFAVKIENQSYYNGINNWNTNAPFSKAPEGSSFAEEAADGYTEVEMEMIEPHRTTNGVFYFWDQQFDSEKAAVAGAPTFRSQLENCNEFWGDCFTDETGWMRKKVLQQ
jgi:hypothetical protein